MAKTTLPEIRLSTMIECVKAVHLSYYVETAFASRGGLMLVGPPGVLKTTMLDPLNLYEGVLTMSDVNAKVLQTIVKHQLIAGHSRTLVLPEVQRLYERDQRTSDGVEGTVRSLVDEGFSGASFEDPTAVRFKARATVLGAMTMSFKDKHWEKWVQSGYARRFLWSLIKLKDPDMLMDAVELGQMAEPTEDIVQMAPPMSGNRIPQLTPSERREIRPLVRNQPPPNNLAFEILCRVGAVLKYYYEKDFEKGGPKRDHLEQVQAFSETLTVGAELTGLRLRKPGSGRANGHKK